MDLIQPRLGGCVIWQALVKYWIWATPNEVPQNTAFRPCVINSTFRVTYFFQTKAGGR